MFGGLTALETEIVTVLLIVLAAFGTAVFHSVGGFAGGLLLAICLAPILGVKETVPVTAAAMIVSNMTRIWVFRHSVSWRVFGAVFGSAAPFIVLSAVIYISLPATVVALDGRSWTSGRSRTWRRQSRRPSKRMKLFRRVDPVSAARKPPG